MAQSLHLAPNGAVNNERAGRTLGFGDRHRKLTVFLANIPTLCSLADVRALLSKFGALASLAQCVAKEESTGWQARATYLSVEAAAAAVAALNGCPTGDAVFRAWHPSEAYAAQFARGRKFQDILSATGVVLQLGTFMTGLHWSNTVELVEVHAACLEPTAAAPEAPGEPTDADFHLQLDALRATIRETALLSRAAATGGEVPADAEPLGADAERAECDGLTFKGLGTFGTVFEELGLDVEGAPMSEEGDDEGVEGAVREDEALLDGKAAADPEHVARQAKRAKNIARSLCVPDVAGFSRAARLTCNPLLRVPLTSYLASRARDFPPMSRLERCTVASVVTGDGRVLSVSAVPPTATLQPPCVFIRSTLHVHNGDGTTVTSSMAAGCGCRHGEDGLCMPLVFTTRPSGAGAAAPALEHLGGAVGLPAPRAKRPAPLQSRQEVAADTSDRPRKRSMLVDGVWKAEEVLRGRPIASVAGDSLRAAAEAVVLWVPKEEAQHGAHARART
jgi:hypothetical protein